MATFSTLDFGIDGGIARITLNRPDRLNALSIDLVTELVDALAAVGEENDTWVVILTGAGRAFNSRPTCTRPSPISRTCARR